MKHLEFGKLSKKILKYFKVLFKLDILLCHLEFLDFLLNDVNDLTINDINIWYDDLCKDVFGE